MVRQGEFSLVFGVGLALSQQVTNYDDDVPLYSELDIIYLCISEISTSPLFLSYQQPIQGIKLV